MKRRAERLLDPRGGLVMTTQGRFLVTEVQRIRSELAKLPEYSSEEVSRGEAVARLAPEIKALRKKGYSLAGIAGLLTGVGLPISVAALKRHFAKATGKTKRAWRRGASQGGRSPSGGESGSGAGGSGCTAEGEPPTSLEISSGVVSARSDAIGRTPAVAARGGAELPGWSRSVTVGTTPEGPATGTQASPAASSGKDKGSAG
jgi:hypothetical protein